MFSVILHQPEIPPNTGNIIRLCANTGASLHLIQPLGFTLDDKHLQRAGLDYHDLANVHHYPDLETCLLQLRPTRLFALSTKGKTLYTVPAFQPGDAFLFGSETRGLPPALLAQLPASHCLVLPQQPTSRSLNLSNAVAIMIYEAWRQLNYLSCHPSP